jgi:hypothetical protein
MSFDWRGDPCAQATELKAGAASLLPFTLAGTLVLAMDKFTVSL